MPASPNVVANKSSIAKKAPPPAEKKAQQDLAPVLTMRKSQDFKSKVAGWSEAVASAGQDDDGVDEVVVVEEEVAKVVTPNNKDKKTIATPEAKKNKPATSPEAKKAKAKNSMKKKGNDTTPKAGGAAKEKEKADDATSPAEAIATEDSPAAQVEDPKTPPAATTPVGKNPSSRKPSREIDHKRQVWIRRRSKPAEKPDKPQDKQETPEKKDKTVKKEEKAEDKQDKASPVVKEVATPKKRVVSDGHWRKDRIPSNKPAATPEADKGKEKQKESEKEAEVEKDTIPKPKIVRRSVVSVGLKVPPSIQDFAPEPEPVRVRPLNRRSRSRSPPSAGPSPAYQSSGVKVYIKKTRPADRAAKSFTASESSYTATSYDRPSTVTDVTLPDALPKKAVYDRRPSSEPRLLIPKRVSPLEERRERSSKFDSSGREIPTPTGHKRVIRPEQGRAPIDKVSSQKPHNPDNPPRPVPRVYGKRIEGWLANVGDDPFTDQPKPRIPAQAADIPRNSQRTVRERIEDLENDPIARRRSSGRRRHTRPSIEALDLNDQSHRRSLSPVDDWSDNSRRQSPALRRSGARRRAHSPPSLRDEGSSYIRPHDSISQRPEGGSKRYASASIPRRPLHDLDDRSGNLRRPYEPRRDAVDPGDLSVLSRASDGDAPLGQGANLKRRLTKHSDLISVLSLSNEKENDHRPSRVSKSMRAKPANLTMGEVMNEVTTDELKYQRELRTLVDGVVPVLLNYILKSDSSSGPGARKSSARDDATLTQPIVDMGVALERLKTTHKRIPMHSPDELLRWAEAASKVYEDYLRVWRLGFHDIVVNLAPAEESSRKPRWDQGLQRDPSGDLIKSDGERVDVAYLLKRPLVRLKNLKKIFSSINQIAPSKLAKDVETRYQKLVLDARARASDERARLEDEAAAAIDPTRARDVENLAPLNGVNIDPTRSVGARDYFDMQLYHSSGQQLDCKIELIMRDDAPSRGSSGDLLFCEVSSAGRWLLFPPILAHLASAHRGDKAGDMVVMLRGILPSGNEWREVMLLKSSDEQSDEWIKMLGSDPMPPMLTRQSSFNALTPRRTSKYSHPATSDLTEDLHLPIGERAHHNARIWDGSEVNSVAGGDSFNTPIPRSKPSRYRENAFVRDTERPRDLPRNEKASSPSEYYDDRKGNGGRHRYSDASPPRLSRNRSKSEYSISTTSSARKDYSVWLPSSDHGFSDEEGDGYRDDRHTPTRPSMRRRTSSVPSQGMPTIPKIRNASQARTPRGDADYANSADPRSAPAKLHPSPSPNNRADEPEKAAQPASNNRSAFQSLKSSVFPSMTPAFMKKSRRSSSPLKHEYEPSTASDSYSDSDISDSDFEGSLTSKSSAEEARENVSTLGELKDIGKFGSRRPTRERRVPVVEVPIVQDDGLTPSDSASQAAPRSASQAPNLGPVKTVAGIFCWSDKGVWDSLHPQECEIVVTPGLIEAFDLAQANYVSPNAGDPAEPSPSQRGVKPLVALELTPLVPLRRGTAVDISIRSPPTANSLLRTGNHIMFRSPSPEECERLYSYINRARIDNPQWIALQNERGPVPTSNWAQVMDRRNASRTNNSGSWLKSFSRKSSTYRSTGTRGGALSTAATESSVGTMNTAFSALRRFSSGSRFFNIAKSTILSREGGNTRSTGSDSLDSGAATPIAVIDPALGTPTGVTNAKIRLWLRESAGKWRDMGTARLTVLFPPRNPGDSDAADPARMAGAVEKRVVVTGKTKNVVLLDVTLPEGCFERVARTGIAVSIWEDSAFAKASGGVLASSSKVYMLQMKTERDAAFTFSMVGKLRY